MINDKAKLDFLTYANAVIKSRAISSAEDNLKPVHRRILWTMSQMKLTSDKKTTKCAKVVGGVMVYHAHGDVSIYDALVRLAQPWKMRYPLVEVQGNKGNIIGDGPAASRYTECKLSPIGDLMVEELNKNCVKFKPNYDETEQEPCFLASKFPNLLCNGNQGIAVGISSSLLPHNYSEVCDAINYYLNNKDCTTSDLLQFIKGPDFPTGGEIINGETIEAAYTTGSGTFKLRGNYTLEKIAGGKTKICFSDIPYLVEIESGIIEPLKKLVNENGYDEFEDFYYEIVDGLPKIYITLSKNSDVAQMLDILFSKTRLQVSIKLNNTIIVKGEPCTLSLKSMIATYVSHRDEMIKAIAQYDLSKANHKLTVVIGLQKCLSDIDLLIKLIRESTDRNAAKIAIKKAFSLDDEQADAILDMKLSRLSRLDIKELNDEEKSLEEVVATQTSITREQEIRYTIIRKQLNEIKKICGDNRHTLININEESKPIEEMTNKWYSVSKNGLSIGQIDNNTLSLVKARSAAEIYCYDDCGNYMTSKDAKNIIGASTFGRKNGIVFVTKKGNVKVTSSDEYNFSKKGKGIKLKEGDNVVYSAEFGPQNYLILFDGERILKLSYDDFNLSGKQTQGIKSGFDIIKNALVVDDSDYLLIVTADNKGKLIAVKDLNTDSKGNKGQSIIENIRFIVSATEKENFTIITKTGKPILLPVEKITIKSKNAIGAILTQKEIVNIV